MHILQLVLPDASLPGTGQALAHKGWHASEAIVAAAGATPSRIDAGQTARVGKAGGRDAADGARAPGAVAVPGPSKSKSIAA